MPDQVGHDEDEAGHDGLGVRYDVGMTFGRPAAILVNNMVFYELRSSPVQKAAEVKPVVEGCAAAADVARNGRHGPTGIQQQ